MGEDPQATDQGVLTIVTPIAPGHLPALRAVLEEIASVLPPRTPVAGDGPIPFTRLRSVHFARWVILPDAQDASGAAIPAELLMATAYDGTLDDHVRELVAVARAGLDAIYAHCAGYEAGADLQAYLRHHLVETAAFFVGARWRKVGQIRREAALHTVIEAALDAQPASAATSPEAIYAALRAAVAADPGLRWALEPPPAPSTAWSIGHWASLAGIGTAVLGSLPLAVPLGLGGLGLLRRAERDDERDGADAPDGDDVGTELRRLATLTEVEDFQTQNQMTLVSNVKPGRLRALSLQAVVAYARFRTAFQDTHGTLVGIPSIHFAHWALIDGGRRLLFVSNYDGTWESYLGDFIDRAAGGLTAIWSNTVGFPPARFLFGGGARDEQRFKAWVRTQQIPSDVWYAAYPGLSVQNVNDATAIRAGLSATPTGDALTAWLQRL
jgi:hypothetical protein